MVLAIVSCHRQTLGVIGRDCIYGGLRGDHTRVLQRLLMLSIEKHLTACPHVDVHVRLRSSEHGGSMAQGNEDCYSRRDLVCLSAGGSSLRGAHTESRSLDAHGGLEVCVLVDDVAFCSPIGSIPDVVYKITPPQQTIFCCHTGWIGAL